MSELQPWQVEQLRQVYGDDVGEFVRHVLNPPAVDDSPYVHTHRPPELEECDASPDGPPLTIEITAVDRVSPVLEAVAERMAGAVRDGQRYGEALTYVDETHTWPAGWVERHGRHRAVLSRYSAARGALVAEWSSASAEREAVRSADYATVSGALEVEWDGAAAAAVERITAARRLRHGFVMWPAARGVQWWEWHR